MAAAALTKPKDDPKPKKLEVLAFQIEVENEIQWRGLLRREGLIIVDVFASWAGPCLNMINIFKRLKVEVNDDRLWLATACSDNIDDLLMFKDQSEPCWLFMGGGKPVKIVRGCNVPVLMATIKQEFAHEIACIEGKARRNLVSIDDEDSRRKKTEAEAARLIKMIKEEVTTAESLNTMRKESSIRLMGAMELYTVLAIQNFVIEQGDAKEIKDYLMGDFKIEQEIYVNLTDDAARNLFRIPYEIIDPNEAFGSHEEEPEETENVGGNNDDDDDAEKPKVVTKIKKKKTIPVELQAGIAGETILMILECVDLRRFSDAKKKPPPSSLLQTADDYIQLKVGPMSYEEACEHAPYTLHATYGKGQYASGVWCPRTYDDKRYAMIHFFPRFVTEVLMPAPPTEPKYMVAVYPVDMAKEVLEHSEVADQKKDILAQGKIKLPPALADEMLSTWNVVGEDLLPRKKALTSGQVFVVSVDKRNSALKLAIKNLKPLHTSFDNTYGKIETAKIFQNLKINIEDLPNPDEVVQKFLARSGPRFPAVYEDEILPPPDEGEGEEEETSSGDTATAPPTTEAPPTTTEAPPTTAEGPPPGEDSTDDMTRPMTTDDDGPLTTEDETMGETTMGEEDETENPEQTETEEEEEE